MRMLPVATALALALSAPAAQAQDMKAGAFNVDAAAKVGIGPLRSAVPSLDASVCSISDGNNVEVALCVGDKVIFLGVRIETGRRGEVVERTAVLRSITEVQQPCESCSLDALAQTTWRSEGENGLPRGDAEIYVLTRAQLEAAKQAAVRASR